jgi:hypothetical protein
VKVGTAMTGNQLRSLKRRQDARKMRYERDPVEERLVLADIDDITTLITELERVQDELGTMRALMDRIATTLDLVRTVSTDGA